MAEAYGKVNYHKQKIINEDTAGKTVIGYPPSEDYEGEEKLTKVELGGKVYEVGSDDPNDDGLVINIEKHPNGYFITGGVYSEPEDYVNAPENPREG